MSESLGKATLDLDANLGDFDKNMDEAHQRADSMDRKFDELTETSKIAADAMQRIKMTAAQAYFTEGISVEMERSLGKIRDSAGVAYEALQRVKIGKDQAAESDASGDVIDRKLDDIIRKALEARESLQRVKLEGGRNGVGVGPFGSGFGRIGVLGTAIGAGALAAPAVGPGILGLTAASVPLLAGLAGIAGTLVLAFRGMSTAIEGNKAAFEKLQPSQQQFVLLLRSMTGWIDQLKQTAAKNLFPGLTEGLKSALSPGTVNAISSAIGELAKALGKAGAMWGKYFGSKEFQSIFGPLMKTAAKSIGTLSKALLSLFDALGVLGRAAGPLLNWLTESAARGAKWLDTFIHAKDATGALAGALDQARTSLQLVGGLLEALWKVVIALGAALYPVSKVFVKDLTDALDVLAKTIQQNQKGITEFASGALDALVKTVKIAWPIVKTLATWLGQVVKAMGGWKDAFEIILTGVLAYQFVKLAGTISGAIKQLFSISRKQLLTDGLIGIALLAATEIILHWNTVKIWFDAFTLWLPSAFSGMWSAIKGITDLAVYGMLLPIQTLAKAFADVAGWLGHVPGLTGVANSAKGALNSISSLTQHFKSSGLSDISAAGSKFASFTTDLKIARESAARADLASALVQALNTAHSTGTKQAPSTSTTDTSSASSPFGTQPPWTPTAAQTAAAAAAKKKTPRYILTHSHALSSGSFALTPREQIAATLAAGGIGGSYSFGMSGINLIPESLQLAIDKAAITPNTRDDLRAYENARSYLEKFTQQFKDFLKLPIANEIANLSTKINALAKSTVSLTTAQMQNEQQFLSTFESDVNSYAPNTFPAGSVSKLGTHLYDIKQESRATNRHLSKIVKAAKFPASQLAIHSLHGAAG